MSVDQPQWVEQQDPYGCALACLAMITGASYREIKAEVDRLPNSGHSGDWNREGIDWMTADQILIRHGFYAQRMFVGQSCRRVRDNPADPLRYVAIEGAWPPEPWAPIHLADVMQPSRNGHSVVMRGDGVVLDPLRRGEFRLSGWATVYEVAGLVHP
jgi:hypothetical protein